ncbi:MAG: metallophosphatase domain-containing protein [Bacteroides sp.]|nr:metallophosphatase domain-containing protein [Bacteroides sp.]
MRLLHFSDTHSQHCALKPLPDADIVVHSGDFTFAGSEQEAIDFMDWFCNLPHRHKIFIAGNHDVCLLNAQVEGLPDNVHFLNNSSITIDGLKIHGTPMFIEYDLSGEDRKCINAIPDDADIVVTHQPPINILDFSDNIHYGSQLLREKIMKVKPLYHLYGHVHGNYGVIKESDTIFSNAAVLDEEYRLINAPRLFEIKMR